MQQNRIADLKRRAEELCGGQMQTGGLDDCSSETEESFWKQVVDYEKLLGPRTFNNWKRQVFHYLSRIPSVMRS